MRTLEDIDKFIEQERKEQSIWCPYCGEGYLDDDNRIVSYWGYYDHYDEEKVEC